MSLIHDVLLWTPYVPLAAASGAALHFRARRRAADARAAEANRRVAAWEEEACYFAESRLPALVYALQNGTPANFSGLRHPNLANTRAAAAYEIVLQQVSALLDEASQRAEDSTRSAVRACVRSVQALVYEQQGAITRLLDEEDDERVLAKVLPIDHAGNQLARRLAVLGVIAGTWPGRQRDDVPLIDAIRGAMSRIRDHQRVRPPRVSGLYLAGRYVEPIVLALAELLDNAARHSPPSTPVEVRLVEGLQGVSVEIHDAGAGMSFEAAQEAKRRLSGDTFRLTELRNPPSFGYLGVGALASRYGFRVHLDEDHSVHGGVRAVVFLPRVLLAEAPAPTEPKTAPAQQTAPRTTARQNDPRAAAAASAYEIASDGLAVRGPRRHAEEAPAPRRHLAGAEPPPAGSGQGLAAFVHNTRGAHAAAPQSSDPSPTSEESPR